jgi:hypothetical protein
VEGENRAVSQPDPLILDAPEHRPLYLMLPLRQKAAWATCLGLIAILAVVAFPRIERAERDLRIVATQALATNIRNAALFVNITWRTSDHPDDIVADGRHVHVVNGYPAADSIDDAIWDYRGFIFYADLGLFARADAHNPAACSVRYQPPARPDGGPSVAIRSNGC